MFCHQLRTKEFGIDIGQGINVGPGNFEKKNKHKALNKRRTWRIWMSYYVEKKIKLSKVNKRRAFNKAIGPEKNQRLINVGPTFIPDYRVGQQTSFLSRFGRAWAGYSYFDTAVAVVHCPLTR